MAVTKTLGPLHFEDLEPHRFEDLVRELVYDFKDWQSIEATGRSGSDGGFDIRGYERASLADDAADHGEEEDDTVPHPMEGNLWMIQCKREAEIGPSKVADIINDGVKADNPPYGYVLAAPANFSKKSFDVFREDLRKRGVMEFHLWGRAALEDMLHQPRNDRILFTFFGISLVTRRRSRVTDILAIVARKNKLMRILGDQSRHQPILLRDTNDTHYPISSKYDDFDEKPRWRAYNVEALSPQGLILNVHRYLAYLDESQGEWDIAEAINLATPPEGENHEQRSSTRNLRDRVEAVWHFFPRAKRATYVRNGLVRFEDVAVIDDKGDSQFEFPHVYVEFHGQFGPFFGFREYLTRHERIRHRPEDLKRVKRFPLVFDAPRIGTIHGEKTLKVTDRIKRMVNARNEALNTLYDVDGRYDFLAEADVIAVEGPQEKAGGSGEPTLIQITNKQIITGKHFLDSLMDDPSLNHRVTEQIGREVSETDQLRALEFKVTHDWVIERAQSQAGAPKKSHKQ